jgi:hypothetical protein
MTHQEINDLTEHNVNVDRLEKLQRKQTPKTRAQRLKGFFWLLVGVGFICQFLSALLASSGVLYYLSQKLNTAGIIVGLLACLILLGLEGSKRFTLISFHAQRLDDQHINRISYVSMLLLGALSTFSTYFGTPPAVEFFTATPTLINMDTLQANQNQLLAKDTAFLSQSYHKALAAQTAYWEANKRWYSKENEGKGRYRLTSVGGVQAVYDNLTKKVNESESALTTTLLQKRDQKEAYWSQAQSQNEAKLAEYKAWCHSFGFILALVSIVLEVLFFFSFWWTESYQRLEVKEADAILTLAKEEAGNPSTGPDTFTPKDSPTFNPKGQPQDVYDMPTATTTGNNPIGFEYKGKDTTSRLKVPKPKETPNLKVKVVDNQAPLPLGLAQKDQKPLGLKVKKKPLNLKVKNYTFSPKEGTIIKAKGRKRARVMVTVGKELRPMTLGQLNNLIKAQTGTQRIQHLETLKNKLV